MARARSHVRRKKVRLTSQSLSAVISQERSADAAGAGDDVDPTHNFVEFNILDLLRDEPASVVIPAAYNDASSVFTGAENFAASGFVFGLMVCPACRNEMIYYQQRDSLASGYRFRCRVCQYQLVASLQ